MFKLINFIGFQACWWLLILYQHQYWWVVVALLIGHIWLVKDSLTELLVMLVSALPGFMVDGLLTATGVYIFSGSEQLLPIPFWLIMLWLAFTATLRHSLAYLRQRYWLAAGLGAVGGSLSYIGGMKLGAVTFGMSLFTTASLLVCIWACLMPVIFFISNRVEAIMTRFNRADTLHTIKEKL